MSTATLSIPVLRHGERLSRAEFERRYEAMPDVKAELLDGVVYMSSPVSIDHGDPHGDLMGWLFVYKASTPGTASSDNTTTRLSGSSEPQPDASLRLLEECGGQAVVDDDRYLAGSPELLGEVSRSSADYDRKVKLPIYRKAGVREFILWRVDDEELDWYVLRHGDYERLSADADGILRSEAFPGLWLDVAAMIRGDAAAVLETLQKGIDSPEHAAFVASLEQVRQKRVYGEPNRVSGRVLPSPQSKNPVPARRDSARQGLAYQRNDTRFAQTLNKPRLPTSLEPALLKATSPSSQAGVRERR